MNNTGAVLAPAVVLGRDRIAHFSATVNGAMLATGFDPLTGVKPVGNYIYTINTAPSPPTKMHSTNPVPASANPVDSIATRPGVTPWTDFVATCGTNATTVVSVVDVASGNVTRSISIQYTASPEHHAMTAPRVFFDAAQPTFAWILQPCTLEFPQELVKLNVNTFTYTIIPFTDEFCLHAPSWFAGNRLIALEARSDGEQLVRLTTAGAITPLGVPVADFAMNERSPYTSSRASGTMYALDETQCKLAIFNVITAAVVVDTFTTPKNCRAREIHSFGGIIP